mgnify:CR=1 FL=1
MGIDFTGSTLALVIVLFAVGLICIIKGGDLFVDAATAPCSCTTARRSYG